MTRSPRSFGGVPANDSITLSPVYPAAASYIGGERGLSIRFPRFIRVREDKTWEQATTSEEFAGMYRKQMQEAPAKPPAGPAQVRLGSEERGEEEGIEKGNQEEEDEEEEEDREDEE